MRRTAAARSLRAALLPINVAAALLLGAASARGEEPPPDPPPSVPADPAPVPLDGPEASGTSRIVYRDRWTDGERDRDLWQILDLRVGDEDRDPVSAGLSTRATLDLDGDRGDGGRAFSSLAETFDQRLNALLYTAFASFRPANGPVDGFRVGRQYVIGAETFHVDGASATGRLAPGPSPFQWTAFGGVPVHPYEKSNSGDWLAGAGISGEPWGEGRAAVEWVHIEDRLTLLGASGLERDDLGTLSLWQTVGTEFDLHGRFSWLQGPREAAVRATWTRPSDDLLVVASYLRLLQRARQSTTETDPNSAILADLERYEAGRVLASMGFGEHWAVEAEASVRRVLPGEEESAYNRDTTLFHLGPTMSELPWRGFSASLFGEIWSGAGGGIRTLSGEAMQKFGSGIRTSLGSDYLLYDFGRFGGDERTHVRTVYTRVQAPLSKMLSLEVQYSWEKDDQETFHAIWLGFSLAF